MKNKDIRWHQRFDNLRSAIKQITKFFEKGDLNELEEQGLIQAFEYTHELSWKTLKDFIEHKGNTIIYGSKDATREAFKLGLVVNGDVWMKMIESRNLTSHTYNEIIAKEMVADIQQSYFDQFLLLEKKLLTLLEEEK